MISDINKLIWTITNEFYDKYQDAKEEAECIAGYNQVEVKSHDFGLIAEEAGDKRVQYYVITEKGQLRKDGYVLR